MEITDVGQIPGISMALAQGDVMSKVGTSLLSKTLDVASAEMANITKMMELSVNPNIGGNLDISV